MKIIILVFACLMLAGAQETFEVKELKPADVQELRELDKHVEQAVARFAEAQKALNEANSKRDQLTAKIKSELGAFEYDTCSQVLTTWPVTPSSRSFKRVEIRGKYALLTVGAAPCSNFGITWSPARSGIAYQNNGGAFTLENRPELDNRSDRR